MVQKANGIALLAQTERVTNQSTHPYFPSFLPIVDFVLIAQEYNCFSLDRF
jgi:hypothetical protein